jgi:hypothetical protein
MITGAPAFPLSIPREIGRLEGHYEFEILGEDRIAGLETQVIAIKPRDAWRFGYRLWLDERNAMVLRSVLLDEQGSDRATDVHRFTDQAADRRSRFSIANASAGYDASWPNRNPAEQPPRRSSRCTRRRGAWNSCRQVLSRCCTTGLRKARASRIRPSIWCSPMGWRPFRCFWSAWIRCAGPAFAGGSQLGSMNAFGKAGRIIRSGGR